MNSVTGRRNGFPLSILGAFAFFLVLWILDYPKPMVDDLFYCGAGLNMANGGDFSNPFLARVEFPSRLFFVYPPLHSYAIFGWVKVFGISAGSMTGFAMLMHFITAAATITILRRNGSPRWLEWLVPVGVATALLPIGLRTEPFAVALTMSGFALLDGRAKNVAVQFAGFLLLFLGGSAAPRMTPFAAVLVALAGWRLWQRTEVNGARRFAFLVPAGSALVLTLLVFLAMIGFRVTEFWETFHFTANKIVGGSKSHLLAAYLRDPLWSMSLWPLAVLAAALVVPAWKLGTDKLTGLAFTIGAGYPLAMMLGGLGFGTIWWVILPLFLLAASVLIRVKCARAWNRGLAAAMLLAFLAADRRYALEILGIVSGGIQRDVGSQRDAALVVSGAPGHAVQLDDWVARYTFGYRTPPQSIDWGTATLFPGGYLDTQLWRRGDVFLLSPGSLNLLRHYTLLQRPEPDLWAPPGLKGRPRFKFPRQVFVVPIEDCRGVRPEFVPPKGPQPSPDLFGGG